MRNNYLAADPPARRRAGLHRCTQIALDIKIIKEKTSAVISVYPWLSRYNKDRQNGI